MPSQSGSYSRTVPGNVFPYGATKFPDDVDLTIASGDGCYVTTEDGEEYLDYLLGSGPAFVGHSHPRVVDAIQEQSERVTTTYLNSTVALDLADRVASAVPCADQVKFASTGSEASYFALRLARAATGRSKVLKFAGAYHGFHDYAMVSSSYSDPDELAATEMPEGTVDSAGVVSGAAESMLVAPYNDLEATAEILDRHADETAAIIVEPVMRSIPPVDGFLEGLRELCDEHDIVLIFDECVTGLRMAWGGAQEFYGVEPDLATLGKVVGGGTPLAAICGREPIMSLSDPAVPKSEGGIYLSGTLSGNPLCATAGLATLDILEEDGVYDYVNQYASEFRAMIDDVLADSSLPGHATADGPLVDYVITEQSSVTNWAELQETDSKTKKRIDRELIDQGILQHLGGKRYISTEHGDAEFERTQEAFIEAVERVENQ